MITNSGSQLSIIVMGVIFAQYLFAGGGACKRKQNLVAVIFGGAVVIRGLEKNLTMNGSLSHDPETGDNIGMNFTWHYWKVPRHNYSTLQLLEQNPFTKINISDIRYLGNGSGRLTTLDSNFVHYNEAIIVNLTVAKDYRTSSVFQIVGIVPEDPPIISQR